MASQQPILGVVSTWVWEVRAKMASETYEDHGCGSVQKVISLLCAAGFKGVLLARSTIVLFNLTACEDAASARANGATRHDGHFKYAPGRS